MRSPRGDTRADSEVVGFAFIFAMALLSILVVTVTGSAGLADVRDEERVVNAASSLEILADNVDDLVYRGAPSRSTAVRLDDATLGFGSTTEVRVLVDGTERARYDLRSLVYDADTGSRLSYVNGAIVREDRRGVVMLREPELRLTDERVSITIASLSPVEETGGVGGSMEDVRTIRNETTVLVAETGSHTVQYEVTGPDADAWERYLEAAVGGCTRTGETVACSVTTERVYVTLVEVDVRFD